MMELSERIRNAGAGTFQEMWNEIADEVAQLEGEQGTLVVGDGLRIGVRFVENLMEEHAALKRENEELKRMRLVWKTASESKDNTIATLRNRVDALHTAEEPE